MAEAHREPEEEPALHLHACVTETTKTATLEKSQTSTNSKIPPIMSSSPPKLRMPSETAFCPDPTFVARFKAAPVKSNQRTALPMLRHHRDGAFGALLPPKSTVASQTSWDKASDSSINPSVVRKNHHKGPPIPFGAAPRGAHSSLAHIHPRDPGHLFCLSFPLW